MDRILAVKLFCRFNATRNVINKQKLHTCVQQLSANDSSSSSSSDSSDSDNEKSKKSEKKLNQKKIRDETAKQETVNLLNDLLNTMEKPLITKTVDLAVPEKKKIPKVKQPTLEEKIVVAAKEAAKTLGGDVQKKEDELLDKIFNAGIPQFPSSPVSTKIEKKMKFKAPKIKTAASETELSNAKIEKTQEKSSNEKKIEVKKTETSEPPAAPEPSLSELLSKMRIDTSTKASSADDDLTIARSLKIQELSEKFQSRSEFKKSEKSNLHKEIPGNLYNGIRFSVFNLQGKSPIDPKLDPKLNIWEHLEKKELKSLVTHPPENYFEEMIQWTKQGILWKFPIDNEQGMEAENNVHFSEHVFMEMHLDDWCPTKGPIRHFMELVCVGLSKNPYLTVEEKKEHIFWFRDYFGDKQELLKEIGAIQKDILPGGGNDKQVEA